jgi:hypothetical protein
VCTVPLLLSVCLCGAPPSYDPIGMYETHTVHGFQVHINRRVNLDGPQNAISSLERLRECLGETVHYLPDSHRGALRDAAIWVEAGDYRELPVSLMYPSNTFYKPLHAAGPSDRSPKHGGVVVFAGAALLPPGDAYYRACGPGWLLHEFAHAVQDRVLGYDNPRLNAAFRQAKDRALYDSVSWRHMGTDGKWATTNGAAYAGTNAIEYFAELSASYLGQKASTFPFDQEELKSRDPAGYEYVQDFWREEEHVVVNDLPHAVSVLRAGEGDKFTPLFILDAGERRLFTTWPNTKLTFRRTADARCQPCEGPANGEWRVRAKANDGR